MTIIYHTLNTADYEQQRWMAIKQSESAEAEPYYDSVGIPTIGVGFNLKNREIRSAVLSAFGFEVEKNKLSAAALLRVMID